MKSRLFDSELDLICLRGLSLSRRDEPRDFVLSDALSLGVDLLVEQLLHTHSTALCLLGQKPLLDERLELLLQQAVALPLDSDALSLYDLLQVYDFSANLCGCGTSPWPSSSLWVDGPQVARTPNVTTQTTILSAWPDHRCAREPHCDRPSKIHCR